MIQLSVIIPTRNRDYLLKKALDSIVLQTFLPENFEVIVIDNGSTDNSKEIVESYYQSILHLKMIVETEPGLHQGRHAGMKAAQGDILVFTDDDIEAFPTWLEGIAESFTDPAVILVGGNNIPRFESSPPEWVKQLWQKTAYGKTIGQYSLIDFGDTCKEISPFYVFGCNFSIRKKNLLEFGGFHPDAMPDHLLKFRGDGETAISEKIAQKGFKTMFNPKASVYHWVSSSRLTSEYMFKRGFLQGISDSYRQIRRTGTVSYSKYFRYYARYGIFLIGNIFRKIVKLYNPPFNYYIQGNLEGYLYHQHNVLKDPALLGWIIRKDYLSNL